MPDLNEVALRFSAKGLDEIIEKIKELNGLLQQTVQLLSPRRKG